MSKIKALITALVLSGSTAAMAAPSVSFSAHASVNVSIPTVHITTTTRPAPAPIVHDYRPSPAPTPVVIRDHRTEPVQVRNEWQQPSRPESTNYQHNHTRFSVTLANRLSFVGTNGYRYVNVNQQSRNVRTIRLESTGGDVFVKELLVKYTDGTSQTFRGLDRELCAGDNLDLQLSGKQIARIAVYTNVAYSSGQLSIAGL